MRHWIRIQLLVLIGFVITVIKNFDVVSNRLGKTFCHVKVIDKVIENQLSGDSPEIIMNACNGIYRGNPITNIRFDRAA